MNDPVAHMTRYLAIRAVACVGLCGLLAAIDPTVTMKVTLDSITSDAHAIAVSYAAGGKTRHLTLDVSRKATILSDGSPVSLASLRPDQTVLLEYIARWDVVTKIVATGTGFGPQELVQIPEVGSPASFCLSENGLTIYFEKRISVKESVICTAHRPDVDSLFSGQRTLFAGRQPTITEDGLEMVFVGERLTCSGSEFCFYSATRAAVDQPFQRPRPILELRDVPESAATSRSPCLASDGLTLFFNDFPQAGVTRLVFATRRDRNSLWTARQPLRVTENGFHGVLACPFVTADGLILFCVHDDSVSRNGEQGTLLKFTRASTDDAFSHPEIVRMEGFPHLFGSYPHYVSSTHELFFVNCGTSLSYRSGILEIRNYIH